MTVNGVQQTAEIFGGGSYCSSQELTLTFGAGNESSTVDLELSWPSGVVQTLHNISLPQRLTVLEPLE